MSAVEEAKQRVQGLLQAAVQLELATLPPYITAFSSIHPGTNQAAGAVLHSVFMEEMLHLLLAGNILNAIGGEVRLGRNYAPTYPMVLTFEHWNFSERSFEIDLGPLSTKSLETFMNIELPDGFPMVGGPSEPAQGAETDIPDGTIGDFYAEIQKELEALCAAFGEAAVFDGDPSEQINEQYYWFGEGKPIVVTDLASAKAAIHVIVTQGEGAHGTRFDEDVLADGGHELAHYFRFQELRDQRRFAPGDKAGSAPTGEVLPIDYDAVHNIRVNGKAADYPEGSDLYLLNHRFNETYSLMLLQIEQGLNGDPKVLYTAIRNGMHELAMTARRIMATPIPNDPDGCFGTPSFEWVEPASF